MPSGGLEVTDLTQVTVTAPALQATPLIGPTTLSAGGSVQYYLLTHTLSGVSPFVVTFTATGLDADGEIVSVALTVTVTQP